MVVVVPVVLYVAPPWVWALLLASVAQTLVTPRVSPLVLAAALAQALIAAPRLTRLTTELRQLWLRQAHHAALLLR